MTQQSLALGNRGWALCLGFLVLQLLIPLRYYLGHRDETAAYDERFAWRMFSPLRVQRCNAELHRVDASEQRSRVNLMAEYPAPWVELLRRNRVQVVDRVLEHSCREGVLRTELTLVCDSSVGSPSSHVRSYDCVAKRVQ